MVLIALLAQGVCLNQHSYTQSIIYGHTTRRRIAYLIWASGSNNRGTQPSRIIGFLRTPATQPNPLPSSTAIPSPQTGKRGDRKMRQRIAKGSSTTAKYVIRHPHHVCPDSKLLNPKRSAKSLSTASTKKLTPSEKKIPRKRRKRQMNLGETTKRRHRSRD